MAEATVVIQETLPRKSDKAPHGAKDGNGETWKSWEKDFDDFVGKRVILTYEEKSREYQGRTYTDKIVSAITEPAAENGDTPTLGTGEYVRGQSAQPDARRSLSQTAWNCAANMARADLGFDAAQHIADRIFADLLRKNGLITDEDIPF